MPDPTLIPPSPDEQLAALIAEFPKWNIRWLGLDWAADLGIPNGYVVCVLPSAGALANRMRELEAQHLPAEPAPPAPRAPVQESMKAIDQ